MELWNLLGDIVILLAGALLLGGALSRFGQSPLVGYLLAGMLLGGPGSIGVVRSKEEIEAIAELGVALLLFSLGLEFSFERLKKLGARPLVGGVIQVIVTMAAGALTASWFGLTSNEAIAFGAMIALSSTAVVLRILMELTHLDMPHGRNSLAVLLTQDMAVVPLAFLMTILGGDGGAATVVTEAGRLLLIAVALAVGMYFLNRFAVGALRNWTLHHNRELAVIFAVVTGLGAAWVSHDAGISPALGAFVAGMLLGSSPFQTQIRADVASFRVVLLTLFFGAAGMVADLRWIFSHAHLVALVIVFLTAGKLAIIWAIFRALGHTTRVAIATGLCLSQIGEFAFVLGTIGSSAGVVSEPTYSLVVSVTIASFILSAFLVPRAPQIANMAASFLGVAEPETGTKLEPNPAPEVVVIGFGPAAQIATRPLLDKRMAVTVIDLNHLRVQNARECGFRGIIGDATQVDVLEHAQLPRSEAVLITVPHHLSAILILELARRLAPEAQIIVRSRYQSNWDDFANAGGDLVVGDEEQVGEALAKGVSQWMESR